MGNVEKNCANLMNEEILNFLYRVSPQEAWEEDYVRGNFNVLKGDERTDLDVIEETGALDVLRYTWSVIKTSERYSLQAFLKLTGMVWKLNGDINWDISATISDSSKTALGLNVDKQIEISEKLVNWKNFVRKSPLVYLTYYLGWMNLALIAVPLSKIKNWADFKKILLVAPLFCYNFGPALLLPGFDWRFFYLTVPLSFPFIFLIIRVDKEII